MSSLLKRETFDGNRKVHGWVVNSTKKSFNLAEVVKLKPPGQGSYNYIIQKKCIEIKLKFFFYFEY